MRYRRPVRQSPPDDPQQYLLYRMEDESLRARGYAVLKKCEIAEYLRPLCRVFRVPAVEVKFKDIGPWTGEYAPGVIRLNPKRAGYCDMLVALHEFAHHVHESLAPDNTHEAHGPQYLAAYMGVLDQARVIPVVAMKALCDSYRLRYNDPGSGSLKALKRAVRARS